VIHPAVRQHREVCARDIAEVPVDAKIRLARNEPRVKQGLGWMGWGKLDEIWGAMGQWVWNNFLGDPDGWKVNSKRPGQNQHSSLPKNNTLLEGRCSLSLYPA